LQLDPLALMVVKGKRDEFIFDIFSI